MENQQCERQATLPLDHPKLTIDQQILHMRDDKGIKFNITSEEEAASFLTKNSYYFKVKAFRKNYSRYNSGENKGKYYNLEFAYLRELSTIDMYLRQIILTMVLDIEHYLKVRLLYDISKNDEEDGYTIITEFLSNFPDVESRIDAKKDSSYCADLIRWHTGQFAVWSMVEILSFGDLLNLCDLYYSKYRDKYKYKINISNYRIVKFLRNAVAHNNCLINNLADNSGHGFTQNRMANRMVSEINGISESTRCKKMGNRFVHDFVVMLCCYDEIVSSEEVKKHRMQELKNFMESRCTRHKEWFTENALICSNYEFAKKIVDKFALSCL